MGKSCQNCSKSIFIVSTFFNHRFSQESSDHTDAGHRGFPSSNMFQSGWESIHDDDPPEIRRSRSSWRSSKRRSPCRRKTNPRASETPTCRSWGSIFTTHVGALCARCIPSHGESGGWQMPLHKNSESFGCLLLGQQDYTI